ncbi:major facilitator superfamily MFS_1 [Catenulispora acidiphila DSM 44928]|uniref:Major facilitator superfamily MFS_1 n=1 Tax=Catenulispora acidiphila (strain DSM 44928 / JCM 14897 / NBRC 102108 / NRRL B-24433 / ID139908) TaxID=479433 RepID=C7Q9M6_CATAD|nr:MFS transporter [Catenulispora acidiphila]ACU76195.1 major facilitator superfamily MFS_1 [Catenulispora acidiphila DSM 44928]
MVAKHYAAIFKAPGSKGFSSAAFVGRLPISMLGLGTILMIKESTGKYALAGVVAGTMALVQAFFGPFLARLIDRRGQAEIGFPSLAVSTTALISLMLCVRFDEPTWTWFASAALAGAFQPNVGALVRARWTKLYTGTPSLHTAYSFEAVMDEVVFMIGPILVTFLTLQVHHEAGVGLATGFLAVGTTAFLIQRRSQPVPHPPEHHTGPAAIAIPGMRVVLACAIAIGVMFGSMEVVTVAFAEEHGHSDWAGLLLAVYAGGSFVAGLIFGATHWETPLYRRIQILLAAVLVTAAPMTLAPNIGVLALVLLLAGFAISPTLITLVALVEYLVPAARLTEGMVIETTGAAVGITAGSAVSGWLIDRSGAHTAYLVPVAGSALALLTALLGSRWLRPGDPAIE